MIYKNLYKDLLDKERGLARELQLVRRTLDALVQLEGGLTSQRVRGEIERYAREEVSRECL